MIEPMTATLRTLVNSSSTTGTPSTPRAMQSAATQALLSQTWLAKLCAGFSL